MMNEVASRFQHHRIRVKLLQSFGLTQAPGEQDGQGNLIQLDAAPVWFAVDPEVLIWPPRVNWREGDSHGAVLRFVAKGV